MAKTRNELLSNESIARKKALGYDGGIAKPLFPSEKDNEYSQSLRLSIDRTHKSSQLISILKDCDISQTFPSVFGKAFQKCIKLKDHRAALKIMTFMVSNPSIEINIFHFSQFFHCLSLFDRWKEEQILHWLHIMEKRDVIPNEFMQKNTFLFSRIFQPPPPSSVLFASSGALRGTARERKI